jgi:hypothetical protein
MLQAGLRGFGNSRNWETAYQYAMRMASAIAGFLVVVGIG